MSAETRKIPVHTPGGNKDGSVELPAELFDVVASGQVRISVNQRYPLRDAALAHAALEARRTTGSTVLIP